MPTAFASEVKGFQLDRYFEDATQYAHCGANTQFAIGATRQALEAAGLLGESTGDRA
jgi:3-oxoacyl-[acyl-carrier-protein] synthase II